MNLRQELERRLTDALRQAGAPEGCSAMVAPSSRPELGDYQANGVMAAAKKSKTNPRQLAEKVLAAAELADLGTAEIAGPGFINIRVDPAVLARTLDAVALEDGNLGVQPPQHTQTVVVDYSGPNLAKEMHVGHLRSTIIGDALARTLEFLGHAVIRQNHVGDWGTQFGMLIAHLLESMSANDPWMPQEWQERLAKRREAGVHHIDTRGETDWRVGLRDLEVFYQQAKRRFDEDTSFQDSARSFVVELQSGEKWVRNYWEAFVKESLRHCEQVYQALGVTLTREDVRGESAYNADLPKVIADLDAKGLLRESEGAKCVFLDQFKGKEDQPLPLIVQKSDGGYLYATTDLAGIRYRVGELRADRVLYVTDSRQAGHFAYVFAVARAASFAGGASLEHVPFGTMLGKDGKPFKTREGGTVKLMDLLSEAVDKAFELVTRKNAEDVAAGKARALSQEERRAIARKVGIGAVKYADLSQHRTSDYIFSWDKMLSLEGNSAPYMQYAYARVRSIRRKQEEAGIASADAVAVQITEPGERALALKLVQFDEAVQVVAADCLPNALCSYLYDLAGTFMSFYESCPVLKAGEPTRSSRLALCDLTARVIRKGLELLGIEVIEQM